MYTIEITVTARIFAIESSSCVAHDVGKKKLKFSKSPSKKPCPPWPDRAPLYISTWGKRASTYLCVCVPECVSYTRTHARARTSQSVGARSEHWACAAACCCCCFSCPCGDFNAAQVILVSCKSWPPTRPPCVCLCACVRVCVCVCVCAGGCVVVCTLCHHADTVSTV